MEKYGVLILILALIAVAVATSIHNRKKQDEKRRRTIREAWGKETKREYSYEEFARIPHYYRKRLTSGIDDATWNDLDMDSLFEKLNHTYSSVGEEYLYYLLRTPVFEEKELAKRETIVSWLSAHHEDALKLQEVYARMGRARRIAVSDYLFSLREAPDLPVIKDIAVDLGLIVSLVLMILGQPEAVGVFVLLLVFNVISYFQSKGKVEGYFSGIAYLVSMSGYAKEVAALQLPVLEEENKKLFQAARSFDSVRRFSGLIALSGNVSMDFGEMLFDYLRMIFHIDLLAYRFIINQIKGKEADLKTMVESMGYAESCLAITSYRESLPYYSVPVLEKRETPFVQTRALYHPLVEGAVANDFSTERPVLVTGSNASGKSTFLKTVAMSAILAQTVHTVCAEEYTGSYTRVISSMDIKDHLEEKESYFMAEIRSIRRMFEAGTKEPVMVFIDEVLKGTNTVERIAASTQILKSLAEPGRLPFAATHDMELTELLADVYENYHFSEEFLDEDIHFSFRLQPGPADTRNAIRLLKLMGYSDDIVEKANKMAERFMESGKWS